MRDPVLKLRAGPDLVLVVGVDEYLGSIDKLDAKGSLEAWYFEVKRAQWESPQDVKSKYGSASIIKNNRVVWNISGNKYRLVAHIHYKSKLVFIRFLDTH